MTLKSAIEHCRTQDVPRLLGRLRKQEAPEVLQDAVQTSLAKVQARLDACPKLEYPADLPVVQRREEIVEAIRNHQVVVLCGETGSGKTTQLPKLCLEAGQGMRGLIGHTQPRRLAARNVAQRIAEELHSELGAAVGYQVRFNEQVSDSSYIKLMTDGILLAETRDDRWLNKYDTIIIDEAHERSLNIDFLLGYLAQLLPKRKDLKVIITSATIDPQRFAEFFEKSLQTKVPMILAEGRSYPVETRYRFDEDATQPQAIETAIRELWETQNGGGDVLVFLPGERDIRETAKHLERASLKQAEILPLYARLSSAQQQRIFSTGGRRRVVLATNVAETSITVPGIKHVVDTGVARISRYSHRSKVQRLPIEPVSQASANQRQGRCGRTSPGICIRLYEEADFIARPEFTEPEIRRTNLANVLLQMHDLRLGDIEAFPFLDAPDSRFVRDGLKLLEQLGAISAKGLTRVGRQMAQLPLDPRLGRVLVAAERSQCLHDALIVVAGLSIQDPRERPQEKQQASDEAHSAYNDERSDFIAWIKLWQATREQRKALSSNQYQKWCKQNFLSPLRLHEWQDVHSQLLQQCRALRWQVEPRTSIEIPYERLHKALLHGLLDRIGLKEEAEPVKKLPAQKGGRGPRRKPPVTYQGARNTRFSIFPASALQKKKPQWLMAWEIVETGRVYARSVATIEPEWLEQVGKHQLKYSYSDPHWSQRQGEVMAHEQVSLFGIILAANRRARYSLVDPKEARQIFIRQALVEGVYREHVGRGQWKQPGFLRHNEALRDEVEQIEAKARRRDVMIDEAALEDFYEQRIPEAVVDAQSFREWYAKVEKGNPKLLM
ncbi:MAG: ATP-dependent RNA helicase HrpA, partial [Gammaproteobacteria bacterium]|nr:ATP-dependent RNA helicase HrpA [Gammaproteobacteria bacterium]